MNIKKIIYNFFLFLFIFYTHNFYLYLFIKKLYLNEIYKIYERLLSKLSEKI